MKRVLLCAEMGSLLLLGAGRTLAAPPEPQAMIVKRSGSQPSNQGSDRYFTGSVRVDPLFQPKEPSPGVRGLRHVRARCALRMAHPSPGSEPDRDRRHGLGSGVERREAGDQAGRRGLDATGREALARRIRDERPDAHRDSGVPRRPERGMDGKGERRSIRRDGHRTGTFGSALGGAQAW